MPKKKAAKGERDPFANTAEDCPHKIPMKDCVACLRHALAAHAGRVGFYEDAIRRHQATPRKDEARDGNLYLALPENGGYQPPRPET